MLLWPWQYWTASCLGVASGVGTVVGMFAKMWEDIVQVPSDQIFRIFFCVHVFVCSCVFCPKCKYLGRHNTIGQHLIWNSSLSLSLFSM